MDGAKDDAAMIKNSEGRVVNLAWLLQDIAGEVVERALQWKLIGDAYDAPPKNGIYRDIANVVDVGRWCGDGVPVLLKHVAKAVTICEITPRRFDDDASVTGCALVVSAPQNWYLTIIDADVLRCKAGLEDRYTAEAVDAAGGMFPEEVASLLSIQAAASKEIQWHLDDIQRAFEQGDLAFYQWDAPQPPEDHRDAQKEYHNRMTGRGDARVIKRLRKTDLFTKASDVNQWLEGRGSSYRLPVCDVPALDSTVSDWMQRVRDEATRWCRERQKDGKPKATKTAVAEEMAVWCRNNDVKTDTGIYPDAEYIRRHILNRWNHP